MTSAIVFPGMGPCDFRDVAKFMLVNPYARELLGAASDALDYDLFDHYRDSASDYSEYAQVAFLVNCLALARWAERALDLRPDLIAGPSFGGKAAAVHSGALDFAAAVRLTAQLSRIETEYFAREQRGVVTMSFVRTPEERLAELLAELDEAGEWYEISCYVDTDFWMLSLHEGRTDWLAQRLRAVGALPLYVMDPPLHASTFRPLRERVEAELFGSLDLTDPDVPVIADQDGTVRDTAAGVRAMLLDGIHRPVRWPSVVETFQRFGVRTVHVCGPDRLWGRVGATTRNFETTIVDPRRALRPVRRAAVAA
ncbi:ACP S-malonyltransferase [Micromonospora auratinigra]|uniref:[acyl-carrier-protein] S-malonyltransferase n=1 Tax=Micromonospora auratinigra TaxID=261654 RepID=A0A1A8ZIA6_9ACTN|nr:ACP S-malonyltransferase [Micromonospora auratinigra]SBT43770.1 Malonyl CoA-acyl carrier protein transacylase [Micromonospora auratinigra]